jgi:FdhE protein
LSLSSLSLSSSLSSSLPVAVDPVAVVAEMEIAWAGLAPVIPAPLADAAGHLHDLPPDDRVTLVEAWLDDPALVDPRLGFWVQVAAGPLLERAAAPREPPSDWQGSACPVCGGRPQASVIAEESGEFMAGSPRSLVCGRCATWWAFRRATCVVCHQEDPRQLDGFLEDERRWVRVDTCSSCRSYVKTFDLRQTGARDVVPLVDDVATLALDVWAQQRGYARPSPSLAGV